MLYGICVYVLSKAGRTRQRHLLGVVWSQVIDSTNVKTTFFFLTLDYKISSPRPPYTYVQLALTMESSIQDSKRFNYQVRRSTLPSWVWFIYGWGPHILLHLTFHDSKNSFGKCLHWVRLLFASWESCNKSSWCFASRRSSARTDN